ncbi:MAG TPA: ABC transporter permease subunit [Bacillota bacterium]|nr:ABC transporter permease subunit [Bacillota bacterium]
MNFLPVVDRELRVAARKRSTFWVRVAAALTGLIVGAGCLILNQARGTSSADLGRVLFYALTWMSLAAGFSAGLFFTSDCLSEEKREGTLGLLFLTELKGHAVVLGKLLATSLRGFYALLALLPILAITQLMGGVTGAQYWKSSLALVNGLFCSLAAGMLVSAISRDSQKALGATLLLLLLLALGGPIADASLAGIQHRGFEPFWSLASPGYVLVLASAWGRSAYWEALAITHLLGWAMLGLACELVPRTWQERKRTGADTNRGWVYAWKYGGRRWRERRRRLLEWQPVTWLTSRQRWQSLVVWAMALLVTTGFVVVLVRQAAQEVWFLWMYLGGLFTLVLYLGAASQASRFLVEARRNGLLELLLISPVQDKEIVRGQWRAWLRLFGVPVLMLIGVHVTATTLSQISIHRMASQVNTRAAAASTNKSGTVTTRVVVGSGAVTVTTGAATNTSAVPSNPPVPSRAQQVGMAVAAALVTALSTLANLFALCWFGMWMGLTSRSVNLATLKTILFVQVIPWFVISFGAAMTVGLVLTRLFMGASATQPGTWLMWWPLLNAALSASLAIAKDLGFIVWSRKRLYAFLREQATRSFDQPRLFAPPPLPRPMAPPPILTAPPR